MAVAAAGFKNLDKVDASINANRTKVYVYFDYNAEYFPIGLRFMFENGEFTFHSLGVYEQGLEPIADMEEARERWNEWTSEATK